MLVRHLARLFKSLETESWPQDFKDALSVHIFKKKENCICCDDRRAWHLLNFLSIADKALVWDLINRQSDHVRIRYILPESQCGFRGGRVSIGMSLRDRLRRSVVKNVKNCIHVYS